MRISDWSSDVCSSDLADQRPRYLLRLQSGRLVQPVLLLMEQATEAQAEKAIAVLKRAIDAAENSNQAGENFVVGAANWRPLHDALISIAEYWNRDKHENAMVTVFLAIARTRVGAGNGVSGQ